MLLLDLVIGGLTFSRFDLFEIGREREREREREWKREEEREEAWTCVRYVCVCYFAHL